MSKFKAGDKVRYTNKVLYSEVTSLQLGVVYTVNRIDDHQNMLALKEVDGAWLSERFELVEEALTPLAKTYRDCFAANAPDTILTLEYHGIKMFLDISKPFSRKFADSYLDVIYNGEM